MPNTMPNTMPKTSAQTDQPIANKETSSLEAPSSLHFAPGLDDVIVAETTLSHVDGSAGELILRGQHMEDVAGHCSFEAIAAKLWSGFTQDPIRDITLALNQASLDAFEIASLLAPLATRLTVIEWMRVCLDALPMEIDRPEAIAITGALPVFLANGFRAKQGLSLVAPQPEFGLAENLLTMPS